MLKGIHLSLFIGESVPLPVPKQVVDSVLTLKVTTTSGKTSGFQISLMIESNSSLYNLFVMTSQGLIPMVRVIIAVSINGLAEVLIDGVVTHHELQSSSQGGQSLLTVTGEDLSRVMDYFDFSGLPYPGAPHIARVGAILSKYAVLGIVPVIIPPLFLEVVNPLEKVVKQKGKDLGYIKKLAEEVGHVFYLEAGPKVGMSYAYWGPLIKNGPPQPSLNMNMDEKTNVEALTFRIDTESKTEPIVHIHNSLTKASLPLPLSKINPLTPPLGLFPILAKKTEKLRGTAKMTPIQATLTGMGKAAQSSESIVGEGTLDVLRYGRVLKARRLVTVRGAGSTFNGLYYVKNVVHQIQRGEYKQSFTLSRDAIVSNIHKVPA